MTVSNFFSHNAYSGIHLFNETDLALPFTEKVVSTITAAIEEGEDCSFHLVEIVFVDESEIVRINRQHLERAYVTDIISFRYDDAADDQSIEGTLYCCAPRIEEQAEALGLSQKEEYRRIIIHGLLHLAGYRDDSDETQQTMREREDHYLKVITG